MNARTILRDLGLLWHVPGVVALITLPVRLLVGEAAALPAFLATALVALGAGQGLYWGFRGAHPMQLRHAMVTAALAWITIPLFGALPYLGLALAADAETAAPTLLHFRDPLNAFFEAVSGFTTTGLIMAERPSELARSLQWWRSLTGWIGGVGITVLVLTVVHHVDEAGRLLHSEARDRKLGPDITATVRTIWWISLLYTGLAIVALLAAGMSAWQAINYGMTGISTLGFGVTDRNLGDFGAAPKLVMIVVTSFGATSFAVHYALLARREPRVLWRDPETRVFGVLMLAGAAWHRVRRISLHSWVLMEHKPLGGEDEPAAYHGAHLEAALVIAGLWLAATAAGTVVLLHVVPPETASHTALFEATSALGNVGLSAGIAGPELAWPGKVALILRMWLGRLEIVPVLVVLPWAFALLREARKRA